MGVKEMPSADDMFELIEHLALCRMDGDTINGERWDADRGEESEALRSFVKEARELLGLDNPIHHEV